MLHHNQHDKIRLVGVVTLAMLVGLLPDGTRANAQSVDDSSARASDSSLNERAVPPDVESPAIDSPDASAVSNGATSTNSADDPAAQPAADNPDVESAAAGAAANSDESTASSSGNGAVLELPQVLNRSPDNAANQPADGTLASSDGNDDDAAQSSQDGQDTAGDTGDHDIAAVADKVGTVEDYEHQADAAPAGGIFLPPGVAIVRFPRPPLFNPPPPLPLGAPIATSPIILPPTSSGPFPSTSPMLMAPRFGTLGSFPGGGFGARGFPGGGFGARGFPGGGLIGAHR